MNTSQEYDELLKDFFFGRCLSYSGCLKLFCHCCGDKYLKFR